MKLVIKERAEKNYYDEFLSVAYHHKKIRKNPKRKIPLLSREAIRCCIISLLLVGFSFLLYSEDSSKFFLFSFCFCVLVFILSIIYLCIVHFQIQQLVNFKGVYTVEVNEKFICFSVEDKEFLLNYEEIEYIFIQHYSISILPKDPKKPLMSISVRYQDEFLKAIKKYHQDKLIVDNSSLYH